MSEFLRAFQLGPRDHTDQWNDDLTVRCGLEVVGVLQILPDQSMIVDLAIDGKYNALIGVGKRLCSAL
jgi:hypothetical protein